ncbi:MAG TPA: hypothetical protein VFC42_08205 [Methylomirabilota bacterium]|nr:hypothetical protein [Methylomirabilota bacterium]
MEAGAGRGAVRRLPDILAFLAGEDARRAGEAKLAERRRQTATAIVETARGAVRGTGAV